MGKKILIVAPVPCYPAYTGNAARIAAIYEQMVSRGHDVSYLHLPDSPFNADVMLYKIGKKYFYRNFHWLNPVKIKLIIKALAAILFRKKFRKVKIDDFLIPADIAFYKHVLQQVNPDIVWINYTYYSKLFNYTPHETLKVLDTHDALYLRFNNIFNNVKGYKNIKIALADEINCVNRADRVICIQPGEELFFKANGCTKEISTIGYIHTFVPAVIREDKNNLLFLANDYFIYEEAITTFINEVWPGLKAINPRIRLFIAGKIGRKLRKSIPDANITVLGIVNDLKDLYDSIDIAINPVKQGSGLKIKVIESLCFGKPVVTTSPGKEGLELFKNKGLVIADTPEQWITNITMLLNNEKYYNTQIVELRDSIAQYNESNITIFEKLFQ